MSSDKMKWLVVIAGYVAFFAVALLCFQWFCTMGMDTLIAFLLSHALGVLVLYYARRGLCYLQERTFTSKEYGAFLLINAIVLAMNCFVIYTLDHAGAVKVNAMQVFATVIACLANIISQYMLLRDAK